MTSLTLCLPAEGATAGDLKKASIKTRSKSSTRATPPMFRRKSQRSLSGWKSESKTK